MVAFKAEVDLALLSESKRRHPWCQDVVDAVPEDLAEDDEKELSVVHPARPWRTRQLW